MLGISAHGEITCLSSAVLGVEFRASYMLRKCSDTELDLQEIVCAFMYVFSCVPVLDSVNYLMTVRRIIDTLVTVN